MTSIRWRHNGRNILLPIAVLRPGASLDLTHIDVMALVDTGATTSAISLPTVKSLGLISHTKKLLKSAHGEDVVPYYVFRVGLFADIDPQQEDSVPILPFVFAESEGFACQAGTDFQAILGMDVLSQCDFSIDRLGRCLLSFG